MLKKALALFLLAAIAAALISPAVVRAQSSLTFSSLEVDLWPEYDRPSVLVILRITLSASTTLPADLTLRIPAAAGEPHAVAVKQVDGGLFSVAYDLQVSGQWGLITFTATTPEIQVEYYDPQLVKQGDARHYEYTWPGDYAADEVGVQLQQPLGATNLRTSPSLGSGVTGSDGLVYYTAQVGSLPAGQEFKISVDYQKSGDTLSAESLDVQPSAPVESTTTSWRNQLMAILPWGLGVLGVLLIVGGGYWYWQSGQSKSNRQPANRRRRKLPAVPASNESPAESGSHIYCHQCGKRASPGDRFCRVCGTKLRLE